MIYMNRLGIWGEGTPFRTFEEFLHAVEKRCVPSCRDGDGGGPAGARSSHAATRIAVAVVRPCRTGPRSARSQRGLNRKPCPSSASTPMPSLWEGPLSAPAPRPPQCGPLHPTLTLQGSAPAPAVLGPGGAQAALSLCRGVGAMEIVAMDMKVSGMYIARQLSFSGVTFRVEEIPLDPAFERVYNRAALLVSRPRLHLGDTWRPTLQNRAVLSASVLGACQVAEGGAAGPLAGVSWDAYVIVAVGAHGWPLPAPHGTSTCPRLVSVSTSLCTVAWPVPTVSSTCRWVPHPQRQVASAWDKPSALALPVP